MISSGRPSNGGGASGTMGTFSMLNRRASAGAEASSMTLLRWQNQQLVVARPRCGMSRRRSAKEEEGGALSVAQRMGSCCNIERARKRRKMM